MTPGRGRLLAGAAVLGVAVAAAAATVAAIWRDGGDGQGKGGGRDGATAAPPGAHVLACSS